MSTHHKGPFLPITALLHSENGKTSSKVCLDPNICVVLTVRTSRKPRREKSSGRFYPDKDRKICCAVRVIGGVWTKTGNSLVGVCGHIIKKEKMSKLCCFMWIQEAAPGLSSSIIKVIGYTRR